MTLKEVAEMHTTISSVSIGVLGVGHDGLPELAHDPRRPDYRPATFPNGWSLKPFAGHPSGPLLEAWNEITAIQSRLAEAEREERDHAEEEDGDTEDEELYQANVREREIDNRVAAEIDHQRGEEVAHDQRT